MVSLKVRIFVYLATATAVSTLIYLNWPRGPQFVKRSEAELAAEWEQSIGIRVYYPEPPRKTASDTAEIESVLIELVSMIGDRDEFKKRIERIPTEEFSSILRDTKKYDSWWTAASLICLRSDTEEASDVIQELIRRPEDVRDLRENQRYWLFGKKAMLIELLGIVRTDADVETLHSAITLDGAKEIASQWIDSIPTGEYFGSEYEIYDLVQGRAGRGLAYAGDPDSLSLLESTYKEFREKVEEMNFDAPRSDIEGYEESVFGQLADAMALKDYLEVIDRESAIPQLLLGGIQSDIFAEYGAKYRFNYWE